MSWPTSPTAPPGTATTSSDGSSTCSVRPPPGCAPHPHTPRRRPRIRSRADEPRPGPRAEHRRRAQDPATAGQARPLPGHPARAAHAGPRRAPRPRRVPAARARRRGRPPRPRLGRAARPRRQARPHHAPGDLRPDTGVRFDRELWHELCSLRFLDHTRGACVLGPVGVGKTHLSTALGHIAIRRRRTVWFARADQLLRRLKAARLDNTVEAEMRRLARVDLLIIDDLALQAMDPVETADFYELIVERHQKSSTVVTSNRDPSEWIALMSDPLLAQSAIDRLVATSYELVIEGESYRRRQRPGHTRQPDATGVS